jgi:hypothetical protein
MPVLPQDMLPQNSRDQAPPASTTASQAICPFSVTTPETRPPCVSMPRTAHSVSTVAPAARAASAIAGAACEGSARPSLGVCIAAMKFPDAPGRSVSMSAPRSRRAST